MKKYNKISRKMYKHLVQQKVQQNVKQEVKQKVYNNYVALLMEQFLLIA